MRGAGRPAASAALVILGTMWEPIVFGPVTHVTVPSASSPAIRSIIGANAAIKTGHGVAPGTLMPPVTR